MDLQSSLEDVEPIADLAFDYLSTLHRSNQTLPLRVDLMKYLIRELGVSSSTVVKAITLMERRNLDDLRNMGYVPSRTSR